MSPISPAVPVETLRKRKMEATQRLLGDTIGIGDAEWRAAVGLPGWTRAHVATHLARNADALRNVTAGVLEGRDVPLYPSEDKRFSDIETGAQRTGLEIQIDLDTSAGELKRTWDLVTDWTTTALLGTVQVPLTELLMIRLHEVTLHHVDLDCGFSFDDVDPVPARWLLEHQASRFEVPGGIALVLESESGLELELGEGVPTHVVGGTDARLWGWLTGRLDCDQVTGAEGLVLPLAR